VLLLAPGPAAELFAAAGLEVTAASLGPPVRPEALPRSPVARPASLRRTVDRWLAVPLAWLSSGVVAMSAATAAAVPRRLVGIVPASVRLDLSFAVSAERPPATIARSGVSSPTRAMRT
jgi:hypothetical protein